MKSKSNNLISTKRLNHNPIFIFLNRLDKINKAALDPNKRIHREKFEDYVDKLLDLFALEESLNRISSLSMIRCELE